MNYKPYLKTEEPRKHHVCHECGYGTNTPVDRDVVSGQEICNRGEETYRGTREKQEIDERPRVLKDTAPHIGVRRKGLGAV